MGIHPVLGDQEMMSRFGESTVWDLSFLTSMAQGMARRDAKTKSTQKVCRPVPREPKSPCKREQASVGFSVALSRLFFGGGFSY